MRRPLNRPGTGSPAMNNIIGGDLDVRADDDGDVTVIEQTDDGGEDTIAKLSPKNARTFAAALLRNADEAERLLPTYLIERHLRLAHWISRADSDPRDAYWGDPLGGPDLTIENAAAEQSRREAFAVQMNAKTKFADALEGERRGARDVYWCWRLNEPAIIEYRDKEPHCRNCDGNIVDRESHTFIAHVKKPNTK